MDTVQWSKSCSETAIGRVTLIEWTNGIILMLVRPPDEWRLPFGELDDWRAVQIAPVLAGESEDVYYSTERRGWLLVRATWTVGACLWQIQCSRADLGLGKILACLSTSICLWQTSGVL